MEAVMQFTEASELRHYLVAGLFVLEIILRLQPTGTDQSIVTRLIKALTFVLDYVVPNRSKDGRYQTEVKSFNKPTDGQPKPN